MTENPTKNSLFSSILAQNVPKSTSSSPPQAKKISAYIVQRAPIRRTHPSLNYSDNPRLRVRQEYSIRHGGARIYSHPTCGTVPSRHRGRLQAPILLSLRTEKAPQGPEQCLQALLPKARDAGLGLSSSLPEPCHPGASRPRTRAFRRGRGPQWPIDGPSASPRRTLGDPSEGLQGPRFLPESDTKSRGFSCTTGNPRGCPRPETK